MVKAVYHIDYNKNFRLELDFDPASGELTITMPRNHLYSGRFERNLANNILGIVVDNQIVSLREEDVDGSNHRFAIKKRVTGSKVEIMMRSQVFAEVKLGETLEISNKHHLTNFETVEIGRWPSPHLPYDREHITSKPIYQPIIDIHTHSSGIATSDAIIMEAIKLEDPPFAFPTRLLRQEGIDYPKTNLTHTKRIVFPPLAHLDNGSGETTEEAVYLKDLSPDSIAKLKARMAFPPDRQETYGYMESPVYQLRYPFTKDARLFGPLLKVGAAQMAAQGIKYAEISMVSEIYDPERIKELHRLVPEIEAKHGIQLRFLAGLPRNLPEAQLRDMVEKLKIIAESPYVVGVDVVGYETNKTADIGPILKDICEWAAQNQPYFVVKVHAGENSKNPKNVLDAVKIAATYGARLRIGHGLHGVDEETLRHILEYRMNSGEIVIEVQPDSALMNNNVLCAADFSTMLLFAHQEIPITLNSDGAGLYGSSPEQMALVAKFSGTGPDFFQSLQYTEERHIGISASDFRRKAAQLRPDFLETLGDRLPRPVFDEEAKSAHRKHEEKALRTLANRLESQGIVCATSAIAHDLAGKTPVLIAGAAGSHWKKMPAEQQTEISVALAMLSQVLDPAKVCFVSGRTKREGVGIEISHAVHTHNANEPLATRKFQMLGKLVEATRIDVKPMDSFTHIDLMPGTFVNLNRDLIGFIKDRDGIALFIGGGSFTSDQITIADNIGCRMGLMRHIAGASHWKSEYMDPRYGFEGAKGMILYLYKERADLFKPFSIEHDLDALYINTGIQLLRARIAGPSWRAER